MLNAPCAAGKPLQQLQAPPQQLDATSAKLKVLHIVRTPVSNVWLHLTATYREQEQASFKEKYLKKSNLKQFYQKKKKKTVLFYNYLK